MLGYTSENTQRSAPQYLNVRHRVLPNGQIDNLNRRPDMMDIIRAGGYQGAALCRFYGRWMDRGTLSELEASIETNIPAF